jgi:hypothetical protein
MRRWLNMKRKIALITSLVMLVVFLIPAQGFAVESDKGLERAIKTAKETFTVPDDYNFDYNVSTENGKNVWYLSWRSKDGLGGQISVRLDDSGTILSYNRYDPNDYPKQKKFPEVSKQEARAIAESFIKKVNPEAATKIRCVENNQNYVGEYDYNFNYIRLVNGVPFYDNNITISVNSETGEVRNYYYQWDDTLVFPVADKAITLEKAQNAYKENLGLRLVYNYVANEDSIKVYSAYTPKYNNNLYVIDALTGEKIRIGGYYGYSYDSGYGMNQTRAEMAKGESGPELTPEELKAVEEASKLLTMQQAEKLVRNVKVLGLTDELKLSYSYLSREWPQKDNFIWHLNFTKEAIESEKEYRYVSVNMDAKSGEIRNFYVSTPYEEGITAKFDEEASRKAVESFLKEFNPVKFSQTEFDDSYTNEYIPYREEERPREYSFNYVRNVNGVPFPGNGISVTYDAVNGKVVRYNVNWFDMEFPGVDNVISLDAAHDSLFGVVGLELQYKIKYSGFSRIMEDGTQQKPEIVLVYGIKPGKPVSFDANTGELLGYDGKPYREAENVEYTDISGHFAEKQIIALAEYGISFEGKEFRPDESIKQKDFMALLSKIMNYYYWPVGPLKVSDKEIENLYNFLIREGVLTSAEKLPDSDVTREDSTKFFIRALKHGEVAEIKGIYKTVFKDESSINPDLIGHVTIASGLGIVSGSEGLFYPKNKLTRAEAAIMIYNYLQN